MRKIKVRGWHGPVELSALIFATEAIVPKQMIPNLLKLGFELKPEEPNHAMANSVEATPKTTRDPVD